eukprot:scaffold50939_cov58-Phaeocystis_antarctica.AAC.8
MGQPRGAEVSASVHMRGKCSKRRGAAPYGHTQRSRTTTRAAHSPSVAWRHYQATSCAHARPECPRCDTSSLGMCGRWHHNPSRRPERLGLST